MDVGEEPVRSRQCVNPDLAKAQKAYVCFSHVTNAGNSRIFLGGKYVATQQRSNVFSVYQRSFRRQATLSDQGDDPGAQNPTTRIILSIPQILASAPPEMIPLSGGFPNPQMFPFKQLTLEVSGGDPIVLQGKGLQVNYIALSLP